MQKGPICPECGSFLPFWRTQFGIGATFACKHCGRSLTASRGPATLMGMALFTTFWLLRGYTDGIADDALLFAVMVVAAAPITWWLTRAEVAATANPDDSP